VTRRKADKQSAKAPFRKGSPVRLHARNGAPQIGLVAFRPKHRAHVPVVVLGREPYVRWVPVAELEARQPDARDPRLRQFLDSPKCQKSLQAPPRAGGIGARALSSNMPASGLPGWKGRPVHRTTGMH
jgi:hypothetical protein